MCGIVGILGREPVAGQLVDALKRLEYRGYDSAGVATLEHGHARRAAAPKASCKNLESRLDERAARRQHRHRPYALGDARPAEREQRASARDRQVAVVHNGIIENFRELREELIKRRRQVLDARPTPKSSRIWSPTR